MHDLPKGLVAKEPIAFKLDKNRTNKFVSPNMGSNQVIEDITMLSNIKTKNYM